MVKKQTVNSLTKIYIKKFFITKNVFSFYKTKKVGFFKKEFF